MLPAWSGSTDSFVTKDGIGDIRRDKAYARMSPFALLLLFIKLCRMLALKALRWMSPDERLRNLLPERLAGERLALLTRLGVNYSILVVVLRFHPDEEPKDGARVKQPKVGNLVGKEPGRRTFLSVWC